MIEWFAETMPLNYTLMTGTHILALDGMPTDCIEVCPECSSWFDFVPANDPWITLDEYAYTLTFDLDHTSPPSIGSHSYAWGLNYPGVPDPIPAATNITMNILPCVLDSVSLPVAGTISQISYILGEPEIYYDLLNPV